MEAAEKKLVSSYIRVKERQLIFLLVGLLCVLIVVLGVSFNTSVMLENGGRMPVKLHTDLYSYESDTHFSYYYDWEVSSPELTDTIYFINKIYSIGDVLMLVGGFIAIVCIATVLGLGITSIKTNRKVKRLLR